jgi:hypothetical protein
MIELGALKKKFTKLNGKIKIKIQRKKHKITSIVWKSYLKKHIQWWTQILHS